MKNVVSLHIRAILFSIVSVISISSYSITTYTYKSPESENDYRYVYYNELLKLALEKTVSTDGPYILEPSPSMNF